MTELCASSAITSGLFFLGAACDGWMLPACQRLSGQLAFVLGRPEVSHLPIVVYVALPVSRGLGDSETGDASLAPFLVSVPNPRL